MSRSSDLRPGTRVRYEDGTIITLDRRKTDDDDHAFLPYLPGWWLREGGGIADRVLDRPESGFTIMDSTV